MSSGIRLRSSYNESSAARPRSTVGPLVIVSIWCTRETGSALTTLESEYSHCFVDYAAEPGPPQQPQQQSQIRPAEQRHQHNCPRSVLARPCLPSAGRSTESLFDASGWDTVALNRAIMRPHSVCERTTEESFSSIFATPVMSCSETALRTVEGRERRTSRAR